MSVFMLSLSGGGELRTTKRHNIITYFAHNEEIRDDVSESDIYSAYSIWIIE